MPYYILFYLIKYCIAGPYVFAATVGTYLLSKEIYVLEHEYYSGLSILIMAAIISKKLGPGIGEALDKQVDVSLIFYFVT